MKHPKKIRIADFDYDLPGELIAVRPASTRDASRLLISNNPPLIETSFSHLTDHVPPKTLMVFNDTRVLEARLLFRKPTGGAIEIFCLEPAGLELTIALGQHGSVSWNCLVGRAASWNPTQPLHLQLTADGEELQLTATQRRREGGKFVIDFSWTPRSKTFSEILHLAGKIPLPPYIRREADEQDSDRYQTVYAKQTGSVAAPTAGLHFTEEVLEQLAKKDIRRASVTLHVGAGTFMPVKSDTMEEHAMHSETIEISTALIDALLRQGGKKILAVGTTSLRTLESIYWLGKKLRNDPAAAVTPEVQQWDPYETHEEVSTEDALMAVRWHMEKLQRDTLFTRTSLLIAPGYRFRITEMLITNFHQPRSTLLLLVAAFVGDEWMRIYEYALEKKFRFLSYGDACLLFRQERSQG